MRRLLVHGLIGIPIFVLVMYVFGPADGALFLLLSILVDVDHVAGYYFLTKDRTWNLKENMKRCQSGGLKPMQRISGTFTGFSFTG